jgi:hypothetical protein
MIRNHLPVTILLLITVALFGRTLGHEFLVWDDGPNIYLNRAMIEDPLAGVGSFWRGPYAGL